MICIQNAVAIFTSSSMRITPSGDRSESQDESARSLLRTIKVVPDNITSTWTNADHTYGDFCQAILVLMLFDDAHKRRRAVFLQFVNRVQFVNISKQSEDVACQDSLRNI